MRCAWCRHPLDFVHGHGACLNNRCAMYGLNQDACCSGESAAEFNAPEDVLDAAVGPESHAPDASPADLPPGRCAPLTRPGRTDEPGAGTRSP